MIECNTDGQEGCLGYILDQQLDKKTYAAALVKSIENEEALWLNENKKGLLMECILALGICSRWGSAKRSRE
eukprot:15791002-Heterocapsa_arctica.AAC.1